MCNRLLSPFIHGLNFAPHRLRRNIGYSLAHMTRYSRKPFKASASLGPDSQTANLFCKNSDPREASVNKLQLLFQTSEMDGLGSEVRNRFGKC
jgi:hypothetical protein